MQTKSRHDSEVAAALVCHSPVVVREMSGERGIDVMHSAAALRQIVEHVVVWQPDVVCIVTPHLPRRAEGFSVVANAELHGDFRHFGYPEVQANAAAALGAAEGLERLGDVHQVSVLPVCVEQLDHGSLVPLLYLQRAGYGGKVVVIGLPAAPHLDECMAMGDLIAAVAQKDNQRWFVLASGEASHSLLPDAPAGYQPRAKEFDQWLVRCLQEQLYREIPNVDPSLRDLAAEDVIDPLIIALASIQFLPITHRFLCYEAPMGVGLVTAIL